MARRNFENFILVFYHGELAEQSQQVGVHADRDSAHA